MDQLPSAEDTLARRRRTIELVSLASRLPALLLTSVSLLFWGLGGSRLPTGSDRGDLVVLVVAVVLLLSASALSVLALSRLRSPRYSVFSAPQIVLESCCSVLLVAGIQAQPSSQSWPMLAIPVLFGASRHQLGGALSAWLLVSTGFVGFSAVHTVEAHAAVPSTVFTAPLILLILALGTGGQARAYLAQLRHTETARAALQHQATHDALTGLPNRAHLYPAAEAMLDGPGDVAVLVLDLNGFKNVNDEHGHAAGDQLLRVVADRLRRALPATGLAARVGGDEFVVVLTGPAAAGDAYLEIADRLTAALDEPVQLGNLVLRTPASIGSVRRPAGEVTDLDTLLARADAAMYADKERSRRRRPARRSRGADPLAPGPGSPSPAPVRTPQEAARR